MFFFGLSRTHLPTKKRLDTCLIGMHSYCPLCQYLSLGNPVMQQYNTIQCNTIDVAPELAPFKPFQPSHLKTLGEDATNSTCGCFFYLAQPLVLPGKGERSRALTRNQQQHGRNFRRIGSLMNSIITWNPSISTKVNDDNKRRS